MQLGMWVNKQRFAKNARLLSLDRETKLNEIGFDWKVKLGRPRQTICSKKRKKSGEEQSSARHEQQEEQEQCQTIPLDNKKRRRVEKNSSASSQEKQSRRPKASSYAHAGSKARPVVTRSNQQDFEAKPTDTKDRQALKISSNEQASREADISNSTARDGKLKVETSPDDVRSSSDNTPRVKRIKVETSPDDVRSSSDNVPRVKREDTNANIVEESQDCEDMKPTIDEKPNLPITDPESDALQEAVNAAFMAGYNSGALHTSIDC